MEEKNEDTSLNPSKMQVEKSGKKSLFEEIRFPAAACLLVGIFISFIYNRFLHVQDAWFNCYAEMMLQGKLPYRDFYFFAQPLYLFLSELLVSIDNQDITFRYYACFERIVITAAAYWTLSQHFSKTASFVGTITSVIMMTSFFIDPLYGYYYTSLLFGLLGMGFMARALEPHRGQRHLFFLSGFFIGIAFYAKQTSGGMTAIAVFLALLLCSSTLSLLWARFVALAAGFSISGLPFALWILLNGLSEAYFQQVFFNSIGQKGGFFSILTGFLRRTTQGSMVAIYFDCALVLLLLARLGHLRLNRRGVAEPEMGTAAFYIMTALYAAALIIPFYFSGIVVPWQFKPGLYVLVPITICMSFYCTVTLLIFILLNRRQMLQHEPICSPSLLTLTLGSCAIFYSTGMSYAIQEHALVPGLAVCVAFVIDYFALSRPQATRYLMISLSIFLVFIAATKKYYVTYYWFAWRDGSLHAKSSTLHIPKLKGFNLDPDEAAIYQGIYDIISSGTAPADHVFTFPNCPLFNYITDHPQPTFSLAHYWDVCPDDVARSDAAGLLANPPAIIVWLKVPPDQLIYQRASYRNGHRSGYDDIEDVLRKLTSSGSYVKVFSRQYNFDSFPIEVWKRKNLPQPEHNPSPP
jgi:hypothetical protein